MSREINPAAEIGFGREAASYASVRPSYPPRAVDVLADEGLAPGSRVGDLAAGTGIFTRLLAAADYDVVAVEPIPAMREQLSAASPSLEVLDGTAESIPLPDGSLDAVTVAQAFHWFDAPLALTEIARVLRPGGVLLMTWNVRDDSVGWVRAWSDIVNRLAGGRPYDDHRERPWADVVAASGRFSPVRSERVPSSFPTTPEAVVERTRSTSFVAALEPEPRQAVLDAIAAMLAEDPDTAGRSEFTFPNHTDVYWCHRLD